MQQETGIGQTQAVLLLGGGKNQRTGAGHPAGTDDLHVRLHKADHVKDGIPGFHMPTLGINKNSDRILGFRRQYQQFAADILRHFLGDAAVDQDGAGFEQLFIQSFGLVFFFLFLRGIKMYFQHRYLLYKNVSLNILLNFRRFWQALYIKNLASGCKGIYSWGRFRLIVFLTNIIIHNLRRPGAVAGGEGA